MTFRIYGEPHEDKRLRQMIFLSAALHVAVIVWVLVGRAFLHSTQPQATAITVELVNPAALGTNLPSGGKGGSRGEGEITKKIAAPPPPVKQEVKPQPQTEKPLSPVVRKEEPKPIPPPVQQKEAVKLPEKGKPVPKPLIKPEPEKSKLEEKKPEPAKVAKAEEKKPETKVEPQKVLPKKTEEKKPEPQKTEVKPQNPDAKPEKLTPKPEKSEIQPEAERTPVQTTGKKPEETSAKAESVLPEERDRQISAALDRIKSQVQPKKEESGVTTAPPGDSPRSTGPISKGSEFGEGGGGVVRGAEFILYTQQLQRKVQESWLVAEKRPGLVASVSFKIQADGEVQDVELMKSSGDAVFDQSVLRAIRKATPFAPPPQAYADEFATQKILMNFGGEGRVN